MSETKPCGIISLSVCAGIISVGSPHRVIFLLTSSRPIHGVCMPAAIWSRLSGKFPVAPFNVEVINVMMRRPTMRR